MATEPAWLRFPKLVLRHRLFGAIVGRLNAFFLEEAEEPVGVLAEEICHVGNFAKLAIPPFFRQSSKPATDSLGSLDHLGSINLSIAELPPKTEQASAKRQRIPRKPLLFPMLALIENRL